MVAAVASARSSIEQLYYRRVTSRYLFLFFLQSTFCDIRHLKISRYCFNCSRSVKGRSHGACSVNVPSALLFWIIAYNAPWYNFRGIQQIAHFCAKPQDSLRGIIPPHEGNVENGNEKISVDISGTSPRNLLLPLASCRVSRSKCQVRICNQSDSPAAEWKADFRSTLVILHLQAP